MKRSTEEELGDCLARLERGESVEECLRGHESVASELRPMLEAARAVRARADRIPDYSPEAAQRGRARMQTERARLTERRRWPLDWFPWHFVGIAGVAVAALVLAVLGFATNLFDFGAQTTAAQAQGVVASAGADSLVLTTQDGELVIRIGDNTVVLDSSGNLISGSEIVPGTRAKIEFEEEDDGFSGLRIEVEDEDHDDGAHGAEVEFRGVIQSIVGGTLTLETSFGAATVHVDDATEVKDALQVGQTIKVDATFESGGSYLAREIEPVSAGADDHDDGDVENHHDGAADDPSDSSGPGSEGSDFEYDGSENSGPDSSSSQGDDDREEED